MIATKIACPECMKFTAAPESIAIFKCSHCGATLQRLKAFGVSGEPKDALHERFKVFKKIEKIMRTLPKEERRIVVETFLELYK